MKTSISLVPVDVTMDDGRIVTCMLWRAVLDEERLGYYPTSHDAAKRLEFELKQRKREKRNGS